MFFLLLSATSMMFEGESDSFLILAESSWISFSGRFNILFIIKIAGSSSNLISLSYFKRLIAALGFSIDSPVNR